MRVCDLLRYGYDVKEVIISADKELKFNIENAMYSVLPYEIYYAKVVMFKPTKRNTLKIWL